MIVAQSAPLKKQKAVVKPIVEKKQLTTPTKVQPVAERKSPTKVQPAVAEKKRDVKSEGKKSKMSDKNFKKFLTEF